MIDFELKSLDEEPSFGRIYDSAKKYRKEVLLKQRLALTKMRAAWKRALKNTLKSLALVEDQIDDLLDSGVNNIDGYLKVRERLLNIADLAEEGIKKYSDEAFEITKNGQLVMATLANEATEKITLSVLGKPPTPIEITWQKINPKVLESFVGFTADGSPLNELFEKIAPGASQAIVETIEEGLVIGRNPRQVASSIRKQINLSSYKAERITRTEMIRASREATRQSYEENLTIVNGYQRMATADDRTCAACLALSGKEYKTNQIMPSHPQCRCVIVPKTKSWYEITGIEGFDDDDGGKIPTGDEILNSLGDERARLILGPSRFNLWKNGTSLEKMAQIINNVDYGPQTRVVPLGEII